MASVRRFADVGHCEHVGAQRAGKGTRVSSIVAVRGGHCPAGWREAQAPAYISGCLHLTMTNPRISVLVKALNEERRIEACLRAAVDEAMPLGGEVILVDSLSTDRTVELAQAFPVRIVQFDQRADCGCAAAVQLGYQFARGEFVYVLDADMVLQPGFLAAALARLQADPGLAGVGGLLLDVAIRTRSDARRAAAARTQTADVVVQELGGGGLYRVGAVRQSGYYLAHRGLAAYEEAELGARLRSAGWRLLRLARPAVLHEGHAETNLRMLRRLWGNGRAQAGGVLLRTAFGRAWFGLLARKQAYLLVAPLSWVLVAAVTLALGRGWSGGALAVAVVFGALLVGLTVRKRSVWQALWMLLFCHFFAAAAACGAVRTVPDPRLPVPGRELAVPTASQNKGRTPC